MKQLFIPMVIATLLFACDAKSGGSPKPNNVEYCLFNGYEYCEIAVYHDPQRHNTCYVTHGTGGGISCLKDEK